jgi:hypothetical protein
MDGGIEDFPHISDGNPNVLNANRDDKGRWLNANWDNPDDYWDDRGASAFLVATLFISHSLIWRVSFVSPIALASRRVVCRPRSLFRIEQRTSWCQSSMFPIALREVV